MSNFHLKDKRLSLKAKGLLSQMLSLPDDWDYTLSGLSYICLLYTSSRLAVGIIDRAGLGIVDDVGFQDGNFCQPCFRRRHWPQTGRPRCACLLYTSNQIAQHIQQQFPLQIARGQRLLTVGHAEAGLRDRHCDCLLYTSRCV